MAKITECKHYYLFIRTDNKDGEYPEMDVECFGDPNSMLDRIDEIKKESARRGESFTRHIDYDYTYFI